MAAHALTIIWAATRANVRLDTREPIVKRQKVTNLLIRNFLILNKPEQLVKRTRLIYKLKLQT